MSAPRPILIVSNHGRIVGGGELSLLTLLGALDRTRWAPTVVVPEPGAVGERAERLGLPVRCVPLPGLRRPSPAMARALATLRRLARETGAAVLHANGSRAMLYAGLAGHLTHRPVIWHVRVLQPDPPLDWLLARLATRIIAISEAVRGRFARWPWARARTVVVPNGIDTARFVPSRPAAAVRATLGLEPEAPVVGSVGRLVPFKGYRHLVEAFARVRGIVPGAVLVVVGEGPERLALERQARALGVADGVRFAGHREDIPDLVQVMDVFVLPSIAEHFGRVLLEAMALGRPVVATAAGGVPEVVVDGQSGVLVPPGDSRALAEAVLGLLRDPARRERLGCAGLEQVRTRFTAERHAAEVEEVYRAVLDGSAPRGERR